MKWLKKTLNTDQNIKNVIWLRATIQEIRSFLRRFNIQSDERLGRLHLINFFGFIL